MISFVVKWKKMLLNIFYLYSFAVKYAVDDVWAVASVLV